MPRFSRSYMYARTLTAAALVATMALFAMSSVGHSASSGFVVSFEALSVTSVDASGCPPGELGRTDLGTVIPNTPYVSTLDCSLTFGSTSDTAQLRVEQTDVHGEAMWMPTLGALDQDMDGPSGSGGGDGYFWEPISGGDDIAYAAAVQPDGKFILAGFCTGGNHDFCLTRHNADGSRDMDFDGPSGFANGEIREPIGTGDDQINSIAIQPDGKIIAGGTCHNGFNNDFCLARYMPDGDRDVDFDGPSLSANGEFLEPIGTGDDNLMSILLQPDGKIVAVGHCAAPGGDDFCLARFLPNGDHDDTFDGPGGNGDGEFLDPIGGATDSAVDAELDDEGRIVAAGHCSSMFCMARYMPDGDHDVDFDGPGGGGDGSFVENIGASTDNGTQVTLQDDGKIVMGGQCNAATWDFCLARYHEDGSRDIDFDGPGGNGDGEFLHSIGFANDWLDEVLMQPDGKLLAAGHCSVAGAHRFCVTRYLDDGSLDPTFDGPSGTGDGIVIVNIGPGADYGRALTLQSDGRLLMVGSCIDSGQDFCAMSLDQGGSVSDYVTGGGSDTDWVSGGTTSMFGACLQSVSGGAVDEWALAGSCTAVDGAEWNAIPSASVKVASTAVPETLPIDATANLRFGVRPASDQPVGAYIAPITFEVLAPDV